MNILYSKQSKTLQIFNDEEVVNKIYYNEAELPNIDQLEQLKHCKDKTICSFIKKFDNKKEAIQNIKDHISKINYYIPLYDEYTKNMYTVHRTNIYNYVVYLSFRFPDEHLISKLREIEKKLDKNVNTFKNKQDIESLIKKRQYKKIKLILNFLDNFNIEILFDTYVKTFYFYSDEVGGDLTLCIRPSFMPYFKHIKPYYTKKELINLSKNMELNIKTTDIDKICDVIKVNDVSAQIILKHQIHIINENMIGLIQYYSLQGSYFMNKYLRNQTTYTEKNYFLEQNIKKLWKCINNSPAFDKSYILYRFIHDDAHIKHLKIGDKYIDNSFISTTRDPFYLTENYKFGFILIKIKIPANVKGIALCMETYSHFPNEEEVIFSPNTILKLEKKDNNALYYHPDEKYVAKIETRYEFKYIGKKNIKFIDRPILDNNNNIIDFLDIKKSNAVTINEKIDFFVKNYANELYQIKVKIDKNYYDIVLEWFDSTEVYKRYYALRTNNGFSMYTIVNNYFAFMIEIGEDNNSVCMYVNYYFKYSTGQKDELIKDESLINFVSKVAYYFDIRVVILYAQYTSCDFVNNNNSINHGGNYCLDFYNFLKHNKKRFGKIDSTIIKPKFSYYDLERLENISPLKILLRNDQDLLYQLYDDSFKINTKKDNLKEFYLWIIENHCVFANTLIDKMDRVFEYNNPFELDYYLLDPSIYLYNNNLIQGIDDKLTNNYYAKNEYRFENVNRDRLPSINDFNNFRRN